MLGGLKGRRDKRLRWGIARTFRWTTVVTPYTLNRTQRRRVNCGRGGARSDWEPGRQGRMMCVLLGVSRENRRSALLAVQGGRGNELARVLPVRGEDTC